VGGQEPTNWKLSKRTLELALDEPLTDSLRKTVLPVREELRVPVCRAYEVGAV